MVQKATQQFSFVFDSCGMEECGMERTEALRQSCKSLHSLSFKEKPSMKGLFGRKKGNKL